MTAGDSGHRLPDADRRQSAMRLPLAFAGLVTISVMAMVMYELFSFIEKRTTGWAHRGSQAA
jgi:NitT/TauT family transport system permease protein